VAFRTAAENDQPGGMWAALKESIRREIKTATSEALVQGRDELQSTMKRQGELQGVLTRISKDFGPAALDPESDLYQRASAEGFRMRKQYGDGILDSQPDRQYDCFLRASQEDRSRMDTELTDLRAQLDKHKRQQSLMSGGDMSAARNETSEERLKSGDLKGAIQSLALSKHPDYRE